MNPQPPTRTNPLTGMDQFRRLLAFVRPYSGRLLLALAAILAHGLLGLAGPYTLQFPVGAVFQQNDPRCWTASRPSWRNAHIRSRSPFPKREGGRGVRSVPIGLELATGRRGITPGTALRLAKFFGTSPDFWSAPVIGHRV